MIDLQYISGEWRSRTVANDGGTPSMTVRDHLRPARLLILRNGHAIGTSLHINERGLIRLRCDACGGEACASVGACGATLVAGNLLDARCAS